MAEYVGEPFHPVTKVIFVLVGFVVLLSGVLGNGLLLVVLGRYRPLWQAHNVFIASLALADLLIICTGIAPTIFDLILGYHPVANEVHCRVNACILTASCYVSVMSLVGISLNRYMRVCHTQRFFAWFSLRKNVIICLCLWTLGIVVTIPSVTGWLPTFKFNEKAHACLKRGDRRVDGTVFPTLLVLSVLLISFCNCAIFCYWRKSSQRLRINNSKNIITFQANDESVESGTENENRDLEIAAVANQSNLTTHTGSATDSGISHEANFAESSQTVSVSPGESFPDSSTENLDVTTKTAPSPSAEVPATQEQSSTIFGQDSRAPHTMKKTEDTSSRRAGRRNTHTLTSAEKTLIRSLLVISIVLFVLFLQYAVVSALDSVYGVPAELVEAASILLAANSAVNWIIYGAMNTSYRQAYAHILPCCKRCARSG